MKKFYLLALLPLLLISCGNDNDEPNNGGNSEAKINWTTAADSSSMSLINNFWNPGKHHFNKDNNGSIGEYDYWPEAHGLDVLVDAYNRTNDNFYKNYFSEWFEGVKIKNGNRWKNDFYDDMEWIALALLRTYDATNDTKYKDATLEIWGYIKEGWNNQAGGGIQWKSDQPWSKNACSNGPACILAARLYQRFGNEADREWALKIYNWEKSTLFNSNNGMVLDNINAETGQKQDWVFTYNQGTFIGSAVELHKITGEKNYLNDAVLAANYTTSTLVENSILKSEGTGDGGLFKGIFIRYFTELIQQERLDASVKKRYIQFMKYNAEMLWTEGTTKPAVFFGPNWRLKPGSSTGLTEQTSGCMLIEAMATLDKKGFFK